MDTVPVERDLVSIRITEKLQHFSELQHFPDASSKPSIFTVHERLRKENEDAYEPKIISIGPHHRGKAILGAMEDNKIRFLKQVLDRKNDSNTDGYVTAMRKLEERARKCYADLIRLNSDEFVEMMVLDSCFIVEIFREWEKFAIDELHPVSNTSDIDPIFEMRHNWVFIRRDLILFENQLPFFVVKEFLSLSTLGGEEDIIGMARKFLAMSTADLFRVINNHVTIDPESVKHLLDLYHQSWCFSFARKALETAGRPQINLCFPFAGTALETGDPSFTKQIKSVTELKDAGVRFKRVEETMFRVSFKKGVMEISNFVFGDNTEAMLRNVIAYEQYLPSKKPKYISNYVTLLDCLVNSSKDVEILRQHGIIRNNLGDDGVIVSLINKMSNNVAFGPKFNYGALFKEVNKH